MRFCCYFAERICIIYNDISILEEIYKSVLQNSLTDILGEENIDNFKESLSSISYSACEMIQECDDRCEECEDLLIMYEEALGQVGNRVKYN